MPNFSRCTIDFKFEFGTIDGRAMTLEISTPTETILVIPNQIDSRLIGDTKIEVDLPTQIVLKFTGKNYNTDTIVDENGNIVKDIYIKILSMRMDGFKLNEKFLHQKIKVVTDQSQQYNTAYIGFNGLIEFDLNEPNVFLQYLTLNG